MSLRAHGHAYMINVRATTIVLMHIIHSMCGVYIYVYVYMIVWCILPTQSLKLSTAVETATHHKVQKMQRELKDIWSSAAVLEANLGTQLLQ